jgi:hypothetical protein
VPRILSLGSTGPDVADLQRRLNNRPPTALPQLRADGIFGPKTQQRVIEFQRNNGLKADGLAGPITFAALDGSVSNIKRSGIDCGTGDASAVNGGQMIAFAFADELRRSLGGNQPVALTNAPGAPSISGIRSQNLFGISLPSFKAPDATQAGFITGAFGSSIDLSRVFISDRVGPTGRPFTAFIGAPTDGSASLGICVMNCGSKTHDQNTIVHEATHVWQSQHSSNGAKYIQNCLGSQAKAAQENVVEAALLGKPFAHVDFPGFFPMDAYSFLPGKPFTEYGGEQIAFQVEKRVVAIVTRVKSVAAGVTDSDNDKCLSTLRTQDRRVAGVVD